MVSKHAASFRLPTEPQPAFRLIEASVSLWRASVRRTFAPALLCTLASLLPALGLGDLPMQLARQWAVSFSQGQVPLLELLPVDGLSEALPALLAWLAQPQTIALFGAAFVLALAGYALIVQRQQQLADSSSLGGFFACFGASVVYLLVLLLSALPLLALWVLLYLAVRDASVSMLAVFLLVFAIGSLALSAPLAWISVALGLAPYCSVAEGVGPVDAQAASKALVRGRWTHAAIVTSVPIFFYFGASSVISSVITMIAGAITVANDGWLALLHSDWLLWSQVIAVLPTALVLPLAMAGGVLCRNDLVLREAAGKIHVAD